MDPGVIGGLIGMGVMVCLACTSLFYEKGAALIETLTIRYEKYNKQSQPFILVRKENPLLVRSSLNHWKLREVVILK